MAIVYELIKREDGTPCGLGNSFECSDADAAKLVAAGTHKLDGVPIGAVQSKKVLGKVEAEPEGVK